MSKRTSTPPPRRRTMWPLASRPLLTACSARSTLFRLPAAGALTGCSACRASQCSWLSYQGGRHSQRLCCAHQAADSLQQGAPLAICVRASRPIDQRVSAAARNLSSSGWCCAAALEFWIAWSLDSAPRCFALRTLAGCAGSLVCACQPAPGGIQMHPADLEHSHPLV